MNIQQPQKPEHNDDGLLHIQSIFFTLQGEGPFTGMRAAFVRLAGCNLQCPMCDTDYTSESRVMSPAQIADIVFELSMDHCKPVGDLLPLVVLTGGEPFRQNLAPLINVLLTRGHHVQLETNGTLFQQLPYDSITVVCSPKTGAINKKLAPHIAALKYVISAGNVSAEDGLPITALGHPASPMLARPPEGFDGFIFIQPADEKDIEKNQENVAVAIQSVLQYGHILQLQTHKILNLE